MSFRMKGSPAKMGTIQGTAGHSSALKMKKEDNIASPVKARDWEKASKIAKRYGQDLNQLTRDRKKHKKGSDEYNKIQNQINYYLQDSKSIYGNEHGKTYDSKTTKGDLTRDRTSYEYFSPTRGKGTLKEVEHTPGIETEVSKTKVKRGKDGRKKVTKSKSVTTSHLGNLAGSTTTHTSRSGKKRRKIKSVDRDVSGKKTSVFKSKKNKKSGKAKDIHKSLTHKTKLVMKYDKDLNIIGSKEIDRSTKGRRKVEKYNPKTGEVTTTTRRTLKGILTGKGKGKKTKKVEKHDPRKHTAGTEI